MPWLIVVEPTIRHAPAYCNIAQGYLPIEVEFHNPQSK